MFLCWSMEQTFILVVLETHLYNYCVHSSSVQSRKMELHYLDFEIVRFDHKSSD